MQHDKSVIGEALAERISEPERATRSIAQGVSLGYHEK